MQRGEVKMGEVPLQARDPRQQPAAGRGEEGLHPDSQREQDSKAP